MSFRGGHQHDLAGIQTPQLFKCDFWTLRVASLRRVTVGMVPLSRVTVGDGSAEQGDGRGSSVQGDGGEGFAEQGDGNMGTPPCAHCESLRRVT